MRRKRSVVTQTRPIRSPVGTDTTDDGVASIPAGDGPMGNGGDGAGDTAARIMKYIQYGITARPGDEIRIIIITRNDLISTYHKYSPPLSRDQTHAYPTSTHRNICTTNTVSACRQPGKRMPRKTSSRCITVPTTPSPDRRPPIPDGPLQFPSLSPSNPTSGHSPTPGLRDSSRAPSFPARNSAIRCGAVPYVGGAPRREPQLRNSAKCAVDRLGVLCPGVGFRGI